jgi:hypothetical protein
MMTRSKTRAEAAAALLTAPNTCAHCDAQDGGQGEQFAYCDTVDGWLCPEHFQHGCHNCESCRDEDGITEGSDDDDSTCGSDCLANNPRCPCGLLLSEDDMGVWEMDTSKTPMCEGCLDTFDTDSDGDTCEECNNKMNGDICNGCLRCARCGCSGESRYC